MNLLPALQVTARIISPMQKSSDSQYLLGNWFQEMASDSFRGLFVDFILSVFYSWPSLSALKESGQLVLEKSHLGRRLWPGQLHLMCIYCNTHSTLNVDMMDASSWHSDVYALATASGPLTILSITSMENAEQNIGTMELAVCFQDVIFLCIQDVKIIKEV